MTQINIEDIIKDDKAKEIYKKYKQKIPFNVVKFASEIGIDVYIDDLPPTISGKLEKNDDKFVCTINRKNAFNRQIFTIAHQLGHYFMHQDCFKDSSFIEEGEASLYGIIPAEMQAYLAEQRQKEKEANQFAMELLMPADLVNKKWQELKNIKKVAKYFGLSIEFTSIRLSEVIDDMRFIV